MPPIFDHTRAASTAAKHFRHELTSRLIFPENAFRRICLIFLTPETTFRCRPPLQRPTYAPAYDITPSPPIIAVIYIAFIDCRADFFLA